MNPPLLEVEDLHVHFRVLSPFRAFLERADSTDIEAVAGVSFTVGEKETVAIVGESGSGKTTVARAINGLGPMASGRIIFDGRDITGLKEREFGPVRRHMAMMFQDQVSSLSPRLSVRSLLAQPFRIHGLNDRNLDAEVRRLLGLVGLSNDFSQRYPHQLSGGQARRVGVARALALDPRLIIADEPTAGLDVSVQGEVLNLLNNLQDELGLSILIITHNLQVVRHIAHRTLTMYLGRVVEAGPTNQIFTAPMHPYTKALLSATPAPDPDASSDRLELRGEVPSLRSRPKGCEFHTRCPFVQPGCREQAPALREVARGHATSCHYQPGQWTAVSE